MSRQVVLTLNPQRPTSQGVLYNFSAASTTMDQAIFVVTLQPTDPTDPNQENPSEQFGHVASALEMQTLTSNSDLVSGSNPFRTDSFSKFFQTLNDAEDFWISLQTETNLLITALNINDQTLSPQTVTLTGG